MSNKIEDIKTIRKKLNMTQGQLSKEANVSQSLIAKIESGKIDPSYSSVTKIFEVLNKMSQKEDMTADNIMQQKIITIDEDDPIKEAIKKMKKFQISQMPVVNDKTAIGLISEITILNAFLENKESLKVKEIMEQLPPVITKDTNIEVISQLLKFFPLVIVGEKGKPIGIITKSDLIEKIYS